MKVVILCGGKGTRLHEETEFKPKPLVPIGSYPILWHIMKIYSSFGYNDFILCLGYKGDMIKKFFLNYPLNLNNFTLNINSRKKEIYDLGDLPDWNITFVDTGLNNNTGSRIKQIEKYIDGDDFFLTYGDGVADINIAELLEFHKKHKKIGTVTTVRPSIRFGNLTIINDKINDFTKKTKIHEGWIDGGFFVFNKKIFDYLSEDKDCKLEAEPLQNLAKDGEFMAFKHTGFWQCMDTPRDLELLNKIWQKEKVPWGDYR